MKDYYSILGIPRYASEQTIKEAYRRLAKKWHPDANNGDEEAERRMQDLNRAKEILFEHDTRDEYRRVLEMQDALSAENIKRLRKKWKEQRFGTSEILSPPKPFDGHRYIFIMSLIAIAMGLGLFRLVQVSGSKESAIDPIDKIIKRNTVTQLFPKNEQDTLIVPDAPPDRIAQMASALAMLGEYKSAARYWEKYLLNDPHDLVITTNLMLAYMHSEDYSKAVRTIKDHIQGDTNLIVIYSTLGDYFYSQLKPFDADNAYEKVVELGTKIPGPNERTNLLIAHAKKRIQNR